jgi:hypothetical protein
MGRHEEGIDSLLIKCLVAVVRSTSTTITTACAGLLRLGFVNLKGAAIDFAAIKLRYSSLSVCAISHLYKSKTT